MWSNESIFLWSLLLLVVCLPASSFVVNIPKQLWWVFLITETGCHLPWNFPQHCAIGTVVVKSPCSGDKLRGFKSRQNSHLMMVFSLPQDHCQVSTVLGVQLSRSVVSKSLRPMDCSTPGLPVHHQLPELAQTHVHWVGDAVQPSHPLLSPSPAFNLSQHQGLFQWVSSSHQMAKVLGLQLQHQCFQWMFRTDFL